ncbi:hypothetical protein U2I54_01085 [Bacillus pseudomycoides]|uniref:Uncharacterized protein n=1 Tax=Bacillus bingmayongensis TaxID=1150157 RepID=A0ABU5JQN9_9BACI|nr:hypothetical protein [Bacillus pseudomycoides]
MRSFGSLVTTTICSIILLIWNSYSFCVEFKTGNTYFWISGILALVFFLFINNLRNIIKKNNSPIK